MSRIGDYGYDRWFKRVHRERLIYNSCWEDPRADEALLQLDAESRVAMITSAGCNALDYLLSNPKRIHSVDMNPWQNALVELKLLALQNLPFEDFFDCFGRGCHRNFDFLYERYLRPYLSMQSRGFWDDHQHYFSIGGRGSLYYYGGSGDVAWGARKFLSWFQPKTRLALMQLLDAQSVIEQAEIYRDIEPRVWTTLTRWLVRQPVLLSLLGVPRAQLALIERQFPNGINGYIEQRLRRVFAELPIHDNYFWRVYLTGRYSHNCCPRYLKREYQPQARANAARVQLHLKSYSDFLHDACDQGRAGFSHFVLLDHQDWLAKHAPAELNREWRLILASSAVGAKVLMRSAALEIDFLPDFVRDRLQIDHDKSGHWHQLDRVGTYGSTLLATILT
jgi:S-adenosylmethionine-diacylglycerol 3-amino-3-carboxypropyl transferase